MRLMCCIAIFFRPDIFRYLDISLLSAWCYLTCSRLSSLTSSQRLLSWLYDYCSFCRGWEAPDILPRDIAVFFPLHFHFPLLLREFSHRHHSSILLDSLPYFRSHDILRFDDISSGIRCFRRFRHAAFASFIAFELLREWYYWGRSRRHFFCYFILAVLSNIYREVRYYFHVACIFISYRWFLQPQNNRESRFIFIYHMFFLPSIFVRLFQKFSPPSEFSLFSMHFMIYIDAIATTFSFIDRYYVFYCLHFLRDVFHWLFLVTQSLCAFFIIIFCFSTPTGFENILIMCLSYFSCRWASSSDFSSFREFLLLRVSLV